MKKLFIMVLFLVGCGIVPDDETYVTDESINDSDNTTAAIEQYMSFQKDERY